MNAKQIYTAVPMQSLAATAILPIPNNIDVAESTRFSPHRARDITSTVLSHANLYIAPTIDITADNSYNSAQPNAYNNQAEHVESYDCTGAVSLCASMQSNVPSPFGGMHKFSHLNMPGGQWSQEGKFTSQNLHSSHYTELREVARAGWTTYNQNATLQAAAAAAVKQGTLIE